MSSHLFQGSGKFKRLSVQVVTCTKNKMGNGACVLQRYSQSNVLINA